MVFHHIKKLRSKGVQDKEIAVIAPYSLQVSVLVLHGACKLPMQKLPMKIIISSQAHLKYFLVRQVNPRVILCVFMQVELVRERVRTVSPSSASDSLEVHTVDGFQGREKEAIIISLTRSNEKGICTFIA